jgi:hypothetical protein
MVDPTLRAMLDAPIGSRDLQSKDDPRAPVFLPEALEAARRASKVWLPEGKRSTNSKEAREKRQAFYEQQIDLEDAVEAAGGHRGEVRSQVA